jgi:hypothetical protein
MLATEEPTTPGALRSRAKVALLRARHGFSAAINESNKLAAAVLSCEAAEAALSHARESTTSAINALRLGQLKQAFDFVDQADASIAQVHRSLLINDKCNSGAYTTISFTNTTATPAVNNNITTSWRAPLIAEAHSQSLIISAVRASVSIVSGDAACAYSDLGSLLLTTHIEGPSLALLWLIRARASAALGACAGLGGAFLACELMASKAFLLSGRGQPEHAADAGAVKALKESRKGGAGAGAGVGAGEWGACGSLIASFSSSALLVPSVLGSRAERSAIAAAFIATTISERNELILDCQAADNHPTLATRAATVIGLSSAAQADAIRAGAETCARLSFTRLTTLKDLERARIIFMKDASVLRKDGILVCASVLDDIANKEVNSSCSSG